MPDQQSWVSPVELGAGGRIAWKMLAWQRSPLCMACGRRTVLVTPIQPAEGGGWVVAGHLPPEGATLEASAFPEIRHRDELLLCWGCAVSGEADDRIAEAVVASSSECAVCGRSSAHERGFCVHHWGLLPKAARQAITWLGRQWAAARREYLACRGDWREVTDLARRHAELIGNAAQGVPAAAPPGVAARGATLEAGTRVRATTTRPVQVKTGQPAQMIEAGMTGTVAYTVAVVAGRRVAVDWEFPTGRVRRYPTPSDLFVPLDAAAESPASGVGVEGRGWTYEEAVAAAAAKLSAKDGATLDVEILEEDSEGLTVVRVSVARPSSASTPR